MSILSFLLVLSLISVSICQICTDYNCLANGQCQCKTQIVCAAGQPCTIICGGFESCLNAVIDASQASSLTLSCSGQASCQSTKITCPQNGGSCSINCPSFDSCLYTNIVGSAYSNGFNLQCTGQSSCQQATVSSNSGSSIIACTQFDSCYQTTFDASRSSSLDLNCQAQQSCQQVRLACPSSGGSCSVNCPSFESCYNMQFQASGSSSLSVHCTAQQACQDTVIACPANSNGSCSMSCTAFESCYHTSITAPSYLCLTCTAQSACQASSVVTGTYAAVYCSEAQSCYGVTWNTYSPLTHGNLYINCGSQGCQSSNLNCPSGTLDWTSISCAQSQYCPSVSCQSAGFSNPTSTFACPNIPGAPVVTPPNPTPCQYCPCSCPSTPSTCNFPLFPTGTPYGCTSYCVENSYYINCNESGTKLSGNVQVLSLVALVGELIFESGLWSFFVTENIVPSLVVVGTVEFQNAEIQVVLNKTIVGSETYTIVSVSSSTTNNGRSLKRSSNTPTVNVVSSSGQLLTSETFTDVSGNVLVRVTATDLVPATGNISSAPSGGETNNVQSSVNFGTSFAQRLESTWYNMLLSKDVSTYYVDEQ